MPAPLSSVHSIDAVDRVRAALAAGASGRPADAIVALRDAARLVPRLPVVDLHLVVSEQGIGDSLELVALCTPAQVRALIDLGVWSRDEVVVERLEEWIDVLCALAPDVAARVLREVDAELLEFYLRTRLRIHDPSVEEVPETAAIAWVSPDGAFVCEPTVEGEAALRVVRLLDRLDVLDAARTRALLLEARSATLAELEETSYRLAAARLADLGFFESHDAAAVYAYLDPSTVRIGEATADGGVPPADADEARPGSAVTPADAATDFWTLALAGVRDPAEREQIGLALVALANRVLRVEEADPGDADELRAALARVRTTLSLGLELVCDGDAGRGPAALGSIALVRLFRAAHSLGLDLARRARALAGTLDPERLDPPLADVFRALGGARPLYAPALDGARRPEFRPFQSLGEAQRTAAALDEAAAAVEVTGMLGFDLQMLPTAGILPEADAATLGDVVRTAVAQALLGRPFALVPLVAPDLDALAGRAIDRASVERLLAERAPHPLLPRLAARWIDPLRDEVARWRPPVDPRFVGGVVRRVP